MPLPVESPDLYHFSTEMRVRLPETDAMGIVFHGCYFTYLEVGRADYLRNLDLLEPAGIIRGFDNVVVSAGCDFKSPTRFDDPLVVHVRVAELGRSSFTFRFRIMHKRANRLLALGETVHCALDTASFRAIEVPEDFRQAVRAFEGDSVLLKPASSRRKKGNRAP